tara:strand:+ start:2142 stop:2276 length:135 start_codon:yes stop_codon:yes gene_type:complete
MMKKIILILLFYCAITSCGKKGDPIYKDAEKKTNLVNSILINKA